MQTGCVAARAPRGLVARVVVLGLALIVMQGVVSAQQISENAWRQIQALLDEKESRTPAQQKLDCQLVYRLKRNRGQLLADGLALRDTLEIGLDGKTLVDINAEVTDGLLAAIKNGGGEIVSSFPRFNAVRARITLELAEALAALPAVKFIRQADRCATSKLTTSQGDVAHRANLVRSTFATSATGIRIGVLSDGLDSSATLQGSGDLPTSLTALPGQAGSGNGAEGSAMLEIVYDLCPGASLYFATAFSGQASFATNILNLRAAGCDIIIDDVSYFIEPAFQDGIIAQAVTSVTATGALYFSSAGNDGNKDAGTACVWEGDFLAAASRPAPIGYGTAHDFGGSTNFNQMTANSPSEIIMQWSDPFGGSGNDYDLFYLNPTRTSVVAASTNVQNGTQDPWEGFDTTGFNDTGYNLVIIKKDGALPRYLRLIEHRGRLAMSTAGSIWGHACAPGAYGVAAVNVATAGGGAFVSVATTPTLETFSSDGPRRVFYNTDGTTITPGNVSSTGGTVRQKPDITAADGVACSAPGFNPFFGTSAAAPHAGAIAALIKAHNPGITPPEILSRITTYARDMGAPGYDRDSGRGVMDALCEATPVELASFDATQYGNAVVLEWRTGYEVSNLGFFLYREEGGQRTRITPQLIAGGALMAGADGILTAGQPYSFCDIPPAGAGGAKYWLEDVDLNGKRTLHGPVTPIFSDNPFPKKSVPVLLAQVGRKTEDTGVRVQNLKAALRKSPAARVTRRAEPLKAIAATPEAEEKNEERPVGPRAKQWELAAGPAVKIQVNQEGWYRLSQSELVAAGLAAKADPRLLQLYRNGVEQPILVKGEQDGRFERPDCVEFYGTGQDTLWTDAGTYWLVVGTRPGKRIATAAGGGAGSPAAPCFPFTVERKDRTIYFTALCNGDASNFFGPIVAGEPVDQLLSLAHVAPSALQDATLEVALQGVTAGPHRVTIQFNGVEVGTAAFDGRARAAFTVAIPQRALREGDNLVTLVAAGGPADVSLVDVVRLTYGHTYTADGNALRFTAAGGQQVAVSGFTSPDIRVVDITNPAAPVEVKTPARLQAKRDFSIRFQAPGRGQRTLLAFAPDRLKKPAAMAANTPSSWHAAGRSGDLVIVAPRDLFPSLEPLKALRERQGRSVALIDVEDLYDEFNFGDKSAGALRDFLAVAQSAWRTPPRALLLAGDASIDPRNYLGFGDWDLVPTKLVETAELEAPSDDWFADLNCDDLPELAVGRLPVRTAEEAGAVVSKIIRYETLGAGDWTKRALLVADNRDLFDFNKAAGAVERALSNNLTVETVALGEITATRAALIGKLNAGQLLVNYFGHGSLDSWAAEQLLTGADVAGLANGVRLPVVLSMTCLNGFFADPSRECLAETLLKAEQGGAVAVWASSGFSDPSGQLVLDGALIKTLFGGTSATLGEAVRAAKAAVGSRDLRRTWILVGDPALRLK